MTRNIDTKVHFFATYSTHSYCQSSVNIGRGRGTGNKRGGVIIKKVHESDSYTSLGSEEIILIDIKEETRNKNLSFSEALT